MEKWTAMLQITVLGNTLANYLLAILIFFIAAVLLNILKNTVYSRLSAMAQKSEGKWDDFLLNLCGKTLLPLLYLGAFYFAVNQLVLSASIQKLVNILGVVVLTLQVTRIALAITVCLIEQNFKRQKAEQETAAVSASVLTIARIVIWGLAIVFALDNLGFNVSAVVAGLGIGGVAVALAAQTILGDLFNYFVIFFDKPFEEGDTVLFDDYVGVIENIGIKSTRIRAVGGEQIVVSNSNLTSSKIRNYKRMHRRFIIFKIGVTCETSIEQLKKIPAIIKEIISKHPETRFERAHFKDFGEYSLNYEIAYTVLNADMNKYLDIQQGINLDIKEAFDRESIELAYPTQMSLIRQQK